MSRGQGIVLCAALVAAAVAAPDARVQDASSWVALGPATDYAPAGMPDFDQRRRGWTSPIADESRPTTWTHDGPVAAAAALWWLDSRAEPRDFQPPAESDGFGLVTAFGFWDDHATSNVRPLVEAIARASDTNGAAGLTPPYYGTCADALEQALDDWMSAAQTPGRFTVHRMARPTTDQLAEAVRGERAVFLLVGFWQPYPSGEWGRLGGHYVALQAADDQVDRVRISDPFRDRGAYAVVPELHDRAGYVVHEDYLVAPSLQPGPILRLIDYVGEGAEVEALVANFQNHNRGDCTASDRPWVPAAPLEAHVDLAFVLSPPEAEATPSSTPLPPVPTPIDPELTPPALPSASQTRRPDHQTPPPPQPTRTRTPEPTHDPNAPTATGAPSGSATTTGAPSGSATTGPPGSTTSAPPGSATATSGPPGSTTSTPPGSATATVEPGSATATGSATLATPDPGASPLPGATASAEPGASASPGTAAPGGSGTPPGPSATGEPGTALAATAEPGTPAASATPAGGALPPTDVPGGATALAGTAAAETATAGATPDPNGTPSTLPSPPPGDPTGAATASATASVPGEGPGATATAAAAASATAASTSAAGTPGSASATPATAAPPGAATATPSGPATTPGPTETSHPSPTRALDRGDARPVRGGRLWLPMLLRARPMR